ncbi:hypothetical protein J2S00_003551 [Caldalkalibacillus uzonensis]|uniref:Uncharacterized protein n=1 Tax=Caldalkalibacillus uzonensis TaxID=353224 RepID=A0ABU0CXL3_9BACI|nr:hypothetical protein [Caldalkalibacillus uzonensis]MDQ0340725.1 hypothetical protein [Caldalkalibacillus uzonensis]
MVAVQRAIEMSGIPTVLVTLDKEQSGLMRPPRAIHPVGFKFGHSLGKPDDAETQKAVIKAALEQLTLKQEPGHIHDKEFPTY